MSALALHYEGWCQIRLATNPDPTDEPRGVSGYSFALAGEPDLDRAIRFQNPVCPRLFGPEVGVRVTGVQEGGSTLDEHPLLGAKAVLLNEDGKPPAHPRDPRGPRFEARDYILTDPGDEAIWPYHIRLERDGVALARKASFGPKYEGVPIHRIPHEVIVRYGGPMRIAYAEVAAATGITDPIAYRTRRREQVKARLQEATDEVERAALGLRLRELDLSPNPEREEQGEGTDRRTLALGGIQTRNFPLTGEATVEDAEGILGPVDTDAPWPTTFWFGGWDCDVLCSYVKGVLVVPLKSG
ncbi:MAG: hypothetical protein HKN04_06065 [Rhodothermaceae bacterium]|nr:hypothetical protein [Rhodothermaceae bacterium]